MTTAPATATRRVTRYGGDGWLHQGRQNGPVKPAVIGRERVLAELGGLLVMARAGTGSVAVLTGEAGIGKSTAIRRACVLPTVNLGQHTISPGGRWLLLRHETGYLSVAQVEQFRLARTSRTLGDDLHEISVGIAQ